MSNIMSSPSPKDPVQRGESVAVTGGADTFEPSKEPWVWSGQGHPALAAASDDAPDGEDDDELDEGDDDDELDEDEDGDDEDDEEDDEEDDDAGPGH